MVPDEPALAETDRLTRRLCWAVAITLLITHATLAWLGRLPAVTPASNDDALYLLLARSLSSFHYVDQHVIGAPGHAQYPPGYPASLALASLFFGSGLDAAVGLTILFSTLALLLVFDMARRFAGPAFGVLVLAPLVFNKLLLTYAGRIATEPPYLAFSIATLWVLTCLPESRRQYFLAGALAILAALTRSIGVSIIAAVIVLWLLQRKFRPALILAAASGVTVGGWLYWTTVAPNQFTERSYAAVATSTAQHFSGPLGLVTTRTINFGKVYLAKSLTSGLDAPTVAGSTVDNAFWLALFLIFGTIGFWGMRKRGPIIPLYFLAYCGILLLYPYKLTRFLMPVEPLVLMATLVGIFYAFSRKAPRLSLALAALFSVTLAVSSAPGAWRMARNLKDCDRAQATISASCFDADRLAFFRAAGFARGYLPPGAAVLTIKEAAFFFYTNHRVLHPDLAMQRGKNDVLGYIRGRGVDYVLISPFVGGAEIIRPLLPACDRVELIKNFGERTILFKLHETANTVRINACATFRNIERQIEQEEAESDDEAAL